MSSYSIVFAALSFSLAVLSSPSPIQNIDYESSSLLPIIELGYERHQAINFNIPRARVNPWTGTEISRRVLEDSTISLISVMRNLLLRPMRFTAPLAVTGTSSVINNGSVGVICPQVDPAWYSVSDVFAPAYLAGLPYNLTTIIAGVGNLSTVVPPQDPRTTEDCLFLDVYTPQKVLERAEQGKGRAPVLVWIYGGGYTAGDKNGDDAFDPAGLIRASQVTGNDGIVFVAFNYRIGAFGWLGGPTFQSNGTANVGLYDQRLALEWIQQYIHLFGGDPGEVTVMGESAGGGSILNQITAFGGLKGPTPFAQAILQSPALWPLPGHYQQEQTFDNFLSLLNVSTIEEARQLPSDVLITANVLLIQASPYGTYTVGPVVDGLIAPDLPGKLLLQGAFDKDLNVMVGHNSDEGIIFTESTIQNNQAYDGYITETFPDISPAIASYVENVLYPAIYDGSYAYTTPFERAALTLSELGFTCNTNYLNRAFENKTYAYQFSVDSGYHSEDLAYAFFNGPSASVVNDTIAIALQEYITSFAINGVPSGPGIPSFPLYGAGAELQKFNATSIFEMMDPTANARCYWWQKALYY